MLLQRTKLIMLTLGLLLSASVFAGNGNSQSAPEDCSLSDLVIHTDPNDPDAQVIGCAGQFDGNDETYSGWLSNQLIWDANGVLTNDLPANVSSDTWIHLAKYEEETLQGQGMNASWSGMVNLSNCLDEDLDSVACSSEWHFADVEFVVDPLLYDQFVFSMKSSNYYALYQVELLKQVTSIVGTMSMITKHALSHLTIWAKEATPGDVEVSGPSTFVILLMGALLVLVKRRQVKK